jgi:hypothetical protein
MARRACDESRLAFFESTELFLMNGKQHGAILYKRVRNFLRIRIHKELKIIYRYWHPRGTDPDPNVFGPPGSVISCMDPDLFCDFFLTFYL